MTRAALWSGTADSWEALSLALPGSWRNTFATGIWRNATTTYIVGAGFNMNEWREEAIL